MQLAEDAATGESVFAPDFAKLPRAERRAQPLVCFGCGRTAHFRRGSAGRGPTFYARPHADCEFMSGSTSDHHRADLDEQTFSMPDGRVVTLDLRRRADLPTGGVTHVEHDPDAPIHRGRGRRRTVGAEEGDTTRRLRPLLRDILRADLATKDFVIELDGEQRHASEFFVRDVDLGQAPLQRNFGIWGEITKVDAGNVITWLRTRSYVDLWVTNFYRDDVLAEQRKTTLKELKGHYFLFIGLVTMRTITRDGSPVRVRAIEVKQPTNLAVYRPRSRR